MAHDNYAGRGLPDPRQPKGPAIILVEPQMGENIGMAARAMLNCGLTDLRLVAPRDGWPSEIAEATASGALEVVKNAILYKTLPEALAGCRFALATGAALRDMDKPVFTPETAAHAVTEADRVANDAVSALVFGPERAGLTNEHVALCDGLITVPLNPAYSSLNLAQAVLLIGYQWYRLVCGALALPTAGGELLDTLGLRDRTAATHAQMDGAFEHLAALLDRAGFFKTPEQRPLLMQNLRNSLQRLRLSEREVHMMRGMLKALERE